MKDGEVLSKRYRVICRIGRGGTSTVYKVEDLFLHKEWALKVFFDEQAYGGIFEREIRLLCRLNHPGLPRVVDEIRTKEGRGILMDLLEGDTLDHLKGPRGYDFSEKQVLRWSCQICDILDYLHHQKPPIIYGDLKPSNILLRPDGNIMLLDLGISRSMITPFYAAPEQLDKRRPLTPKTDLYGLGKTLYVLLGKRHTNRNTSLEELLKCLTNPDPMKRGDGATEVRSAMERILNGDAGERDKENFLTKVNRIISKKFIILLMILIPAAAAGTIFFNYSNPKQKNKTPMADAGTDHMASGEKALESKAESDSDEKRCAALKGEIAAILNDSPENRDFGKLAACLGKWQQSLEDSGRHEMPKDGYRRAKEERKCAEYYLTYDEELESEGQVPRTEAEGLLLDAEKRLDDVGSGSSDLPKDSILQEKTAVLSLLLNLYRRNGQTEQALKTTDKILAAAKEEPGVLESDSGYSEAESVRDNWEQRAGCSVKELHLTRLNLLLEAERHDEAYREFELLVQSDPGYLKSYLSMISYDYRTGRLDEAVNIYHLAEKNGNIAQNPDFQVMRTKLHNAGAM